MRRILFPSLISLGVVALLGILTMFITTALADDGDDGGLEVVASGLDNPRGLNFGPEGALYVAEAGRGGDEEPCGPGPSFWNVCVGATGAATRIQNGEQERTATGLPSVASFEGGVVPDGWVADGPADISLHGRGGAYMVVGGGPTPDFKKLVRMSPNGRVRTVADLGAYEELNNPDGVLVESNPYAVLALPGKRIVVDAAANDLLQVDANGDISTLAVFPGRPNLLFPFGPPNFEAVPTTVALGPDGAFYVGELTGFPFPVGEAQIYRIPKNHKPSKPPKVYLEGFTHIIDIAFDEDGNLYVLEISTISLLDVFDPTDLKFTSGDLIRVDAHSKCR